MPELPDLELYLHALRPRIAGALLEQVRLVSPFLVRSIEPPIDTIAGRPILGLSRMGKRIVWKMEGDVSLVFHLMIAGRFQWKARGVSVPGRVGLAAFDFPNGTLILTEAGSSRQASLHVVSGDAAVRALDRGGIEVIGSTVEEFSSALTRENHTLKRALTDPRLLGGIGNAYSDEILHRARLSPLKLTKNLSADEMARVHAASIETLVTWRDRLIEQTGDRFPEKVTAFRPEMAVHGRYREPCPICQSPIQRIRYAANEANYCPRCQTGGKLLADRSLSKLLKDDWPRTLDELERRIERHKPSGLQASKPSGMLDT